VPPHSISGVYLNQASNTMAQQNSEQHPEGIYFNGGQARIAAATPVGGNAIPIQQTMRNKVFLEISF